MNPAQIREDWLFIDRRQNAGNNPMVGMTVAVAVQEAMSK